MYTTDMYEGMIAETVTLEGHNGDSINAYFARPMGSGPFPTVVLVHHIPGWDELYKEFTRKFAHHGYAAICPNLFYDFGHGTAEDVAAHTRSKGGAYDEHVIADAVAAQDYVKNLPYSNGKVGLIGSCSGGRQTFLIACSSTGWDAAVELWGGNVIQSAEALSPQQPVAPFDLTKDLCCPLLGLFGEEDVSPPPDQVARHEEELKKHGKEIEFHMYPNAGHGFFYYDKPMYRQEQAVDGWQKVFAFFAKHLQGAG